MGGESPGRTGRIRYQFHPPSSRTCPPPSRPPTSRRSRSWKTRLLWSHSHPRTEARRTESLSLMEPRSNHHLCRRPPPPPPPPPLPSRETRRHHRPPRCCSPIWSSMMKGRPPWVVVVVVVVVGVVRARLTRGKSCSNGVPREIGVHLHR